MEKISINLHVEYEPKSKMFWGSCNYDDNQIIEQSADKDSLSEKMKSLLFDFHELEPDKIEFVIIED